MSDTPETDAPIPLGVDPLACMQSRARRLERERDESRRQHAADLSELNERLTQQQADMLARIVKLREEMAGLRSSIVADMEAVPWQELQRVCIDSDDDENDFLTIRARLIQAVKGDQTPCHGEPKA
jgi:hypothetical protein